MVDLAAQLARPEAASVVAPAGFGKTELIARATKKAKGCQLILTHTHAGVHALRTRLNKLGVSPSSYQLDTIAGCALRYACAYPRASGMTIPEPKDTTGWNSAYDAARRLLGESFFKAVIGASYAGAFIDEYQDCTIEQHGMIVALAEVLPCRALGDPMQGIFGFGSNVLVKWAKVEDLFPPLERPDTPWRWKASNPELGRWLIGVREALENDQPVSLRGLPTGVRWARTSERAAVHAQRQHMERLSKMEGTAVAILDLAGKCHSLGRKVTSGFQVLEPVDCKDIYKTARDIESTSGDARVQAVVRFAKLWMTGCSQLAGVVKAVAKDKYRGKKHLDQFNALVAVRDGELDAVPDALRALSRLPGSRAFRLELPKAIVDGIQHLSSGSASSLPEAVWQVRNRARKLGKPPPEKTLGRTLLVKGLQFDHAVLLDADALKKRDLYVALTRATKTLTIISREPLLRPSA